MIQKDNMSDLIFNLRIGKLHIQISDSFKLKFKINNVHKWFSLPIIELY